jgi:two-component SAPR family response regulator
LPEDLYEDWTAVRREKLRSHKEQLVLCLAAVCEASADAVPAIEAYRQLIASNPCNEAAHRGLMRLYAGIGQRHLAVEQFRVCGEVLRREQTGTEAVRLRGIFTPESKSLNSALLVSDRRGRQ